MSIFGFIKNGRKQKLNMMPARYPAGRVAYDNTTSGLSSTDTQGAIDELAAGAESGGHTIEDASGTELTQRDVMQVSDGLEAVDDSTNQKTKIKMNLPIVSSADWNAMTEQEKTAYKASHYRFGVEVPDTEGVINAEYMKLLWENPNTTQAFASQTITLNSSDYDFLMVIYSAYDGNANAMMSNIVAKGNGCILALTSGYRGNENIRTRQITYVSDTQLSIGNGYLGQASNVVNNSTCIPVAIYGIKKNFQFKVNAIATDLSTRADHCFLSDGETSVEEALGTTDDDWSSLTGSLVPVYYRKVKSIVYIMVEGKNLTLNNTAISLGTLPVGYRPIVATGIRNSVYNANYDLGIEINASGEMILRTNATGSGRYFYGSVSYPDA